MPGGSLFPDFALLKSPVQLGAYLFEMRIFFSDAILNKAFAQGDMSMCLMLITVLVAITFIYNANCAPTSYSD